MADNMELSYHFKGKRVVVTGGNKGIGRAIALAYARHGADVVIAGRDRDTLVETERELRILSPRSIAIQFDLRSVESIRLMIDQAIQHLGAMDILINNAGINIVKPALEVTEEDWTQVLDTNLKGTFFCAQQAGKHMIERQQGKIINIVSQMAFVGYNNRAAYCSSKGGAVQLTKALAVEWAPFHINVNAVAPTFIETDLTATMLKDETFKEDVLSRILLGRLARPSDVTGAVLFLGSNAADFITGETIRVDGGWTAI